MKETLDNANRLSESGKGDSRFRWEDARAFLAIARAGTLSGAGASLGVGLATVSRRIERLETAFGAKLFSRHQNGYRLTDDGSTLLDRAVALEEAADAFAEGSLLHAEATGKVRLSTADTLATYLIIPNMPALTSRYPGLCLEVLTDVQTVNLHRRDADLAVRMVKPERGNVQVRCLGSLGFGLYGSPAYIQNRSSAADPGEDRFIGWCEEYDHLPAAQWLERQMRSRTPVLATTTLSAQLAAAAAGLGLAVLPHFLARRENLIRVRSELGLSQDIWLVIHSDLARSRRVRVVSDFLADLVQSSRDELR